MRETLLEMLVELEPEIDFEKSDNYLEEGLLDSFDIIELISMVEDRFEVLIDGMDVLPEHFSNLEQLENLIRKSGYSN